MSGCTCTPACTDDICFTCGGRLEGPPTTGPGPVRRALDRHARAVANLGTPPTKEQQAEVEAAYRDFDAAMTATERKRNE